LLVKFTDDEDGAVVLTVKLPFAIFWKEELLAAGVSIFATISSEF